MNPDALDAPQIPGPTIVWPLRLMRHLEMLGVGLFISLFLGWFAWQRHKLLAFVLVCVPYIFVGFTSWYRGSDLDLPQMRWTAGSVGYKRLRSLEWVAYGASAVVTLGILLLTLGIRTANLNASIRHQWLMILWLVFAYTLSARIILKQHYENRKPPASRDSLSLHLTDTRPISSAHWHSQPNFDDQR